jgi:hypothetical protein
VRNNTQATPAIAICLDLVRRRASGLPVPSKVHFIFASKDRADFTAIIPAEIKDAAR